MPTRLTSRGRLTVAALAAATVAGGVALWSLAAGPDAVVVTERCLATVDGATHDLAPDQAANAALISAVAVRRGLPARAATIGIATAIQESRLRNIDYGDRDSLGLFQQRPSQGWGTPEQVLDPVYATNAFYDALVDVEGYQDMEVTVASDRVQRSAFPDAVADHEPQGRAFASALTGHSPAALRCRLRPAGSAGDVAAVRAMLQRDLGDDVAASAEVDGDLVRVPVGDDDGASRRAWVLAHWAVAYADTLDVVRVTADGREWRRDDPDAGWADSGGADGGESGTADDPAGTVVPGRVVIEVAAGDRG